MTRQQLLDEVWGFDFDGNERTIDVHINRLRDRFPVETSGFEINTVRGLALFSLTGTPPPPVTSVVSALFGFILLIGALLTIWFVKRRRLRNQGSRELRDRDPHFSSFFGTDILNALDRISQGDFDVFIPEEEHDPLYELAESVNRMARQLGTMESQRQEFITNVSHEI